MVFWWDVVRMAFDPGLIRAYSLHHPSRQAEIIPTSATYHGSKFKRSTTVSVNKRKASMLLPLVLTSVDLDIFASSSSLRFARQSCVANNTVKFAVV